MLRKILACFVLRLSMASFSKMKQELKMLSRKATSRSISGQIGAAMQFIDEYGCWCYFDSDYVLGKSKPVDQVDSFCRDLHNGYDCVIMDVNTTCVPFEANYNSGLTEDGTLLDNCIENNPGDTCLQYSCVVEGHFVERIFEYFVSGQIIDQSFKHENGFDTSKTAGCPLKVGPKSPERQCCGTYPIRYPFKPLGGERSCCGQRTFLTAMHDCCDASTSFFDFSCP